MTMVEHNKSIDRHVQDGNYHNIHFISFHLPSSLKGRIRLSNERHQSVPIDTVGICGTYQCPGHGQLVSPRSSETPPNPSTEVGIVIYLFVNSFNSFRALVL